MKKHFLLAGLLATLTLPAAAEGLYLVGDIQQTTIDIDAYDDTDIGFSVGGGYQLNDIFSIEALYRDLGGLSAAEGDERISLDYTAIQLSLLASHALNEQCAVYGRLGVGKISRDMTYENSDFIASLSDSSNKVLFGAGARFTLNENMGVRLEYSQFKEWDEITLSSIALGMDYRF